jgi:hypothetical protein
VKGIEPENPQAQSSGFQPVKSSPESGYTQIRTQIEKPFNSDLDTVVSAWSKLSGPLRAAILAIAATASKESNL